MPVVIEAKNVNELFVKVCKELGVNGQNVVVNGSNTKELTYCWLTMHDVSDPVVSLPERGINLEYLKGEMEWYLSGDLRVKNIQEYSSFWTKLADGNGTVNSNYGFLSLIEKHAGKSQFEWCVDRLRKDPHSRQAVINYNQPRHKYPDVKDFVCTLTQQFLLRDGKLDCVVHMRSNDVIFGLTYDIPWFVHLQKELAKELNVPVGEYHHIAGSLHVYERHFELVEKIAGAKHE